MLRLFVASLLFLSLPLQAQNTPAEPEPPGLREFTESYWEVIKSKEPEKIFALYHPDVLGQLSPGEQAFMKAYWTKSYLERADQQGDSYEIKVMALPPDADPLPGWRWAEKPAFQIEIHTFKETEAGREGLTAVISMAVARDGGYAIVAPVPPPDKLKAAMEREAGS